MIRALMRHELLLGMALLVVPLALQAQVEISLQPRLSWVLPVADVYHVGRTLGSGSDPWRREDSSTTMGRSPALAFALQFGDLGTGWLLRLGVTRSIALETAVHGMLNDPGVGNDFFPNSTPGEEFRFELPTTLTIGFAEVVLPLLIRTGSPRPYVSVGVSLKDYDFGSFDVSRCVATGASCGTMDFTMPRSGTVVGAQVGIGFHLDAWGRSLDFGLVDTFNDYAGRTKHDLGAFVGIILARKRGEMLR